MTRRRKPKQTKARQARPKLTQNRVASVVLRQNIKTIPQIFQQMNEAEASSGSILLNNAPGATGLLPMRAFCLTTIDRPNADKGTTYPLFSLARDSSFFRSGTLPVVSGNSSGISSDLALVGKLFVSSIKVRLLLWSRVHRQTTYDIQVIRFKTDKYHMNPYVLPDETVSLSSLSAEQLAERKAFWLDYQMRKHTVNPVAISQNLGSRFTKYVEVLYSKSVTIDEQESTMDEANKQLVTMNLPINRFVQFNHDIESRYSDFTDYQRTDEVLNTSTTDMIDKNRYHKAAVNHNLWLIVRANNTVVTGAAGTEGVEDSVNTGAAYQPSFDISFQVNYKALDAH